MRIAICDDIIEHRKSLYDAIEKCITLSEEASISEFSSGISLIDSHVKQPYDIIFLDIEMDGMSGLEAGQEIRGKDKDVIIIYVTSYEQYVFKSFRIEPFEYIIKPFDNEQICEVLCRAIKKHTEQFYIIDFTWQGKSYALKVRDIVYIESNLRHVIFFTTDNEYKSVGKLADYEQRLLPYGFLRCHQSFLINMNYIRSIESKSIKTTLGIEIDMSTRKKRYCLNTFNDYITKFKV